jgi:ribosomal protein S18 acetylase RimI-like enzyme
MSIEVRLATPDEAPLVREIMRAAFAEYIGVLNPPSGANLETLEDVQKAIAAGGATLAWDGDQAVGSARFRVELDYLYVGRLGVLPEHRGKGIGVKLMGYMESLVTEKGLGSIRLSVRMSLPGNLTFYEKLGYSILEVNDHPKGIEKIATLVKSLEVTE